MTDTSNIKKSAKIVNLSFLMMTCIVWTHSRLPKWDVVPDYFHTLSIFNEIGQDAVAPFSLITGFLFFRTFHINKYWDKLQTRFGSLVVPYILWNIIGWILWFVLYMLTNNYFVNDNFSFDSVSEVISNIFLCKYTVLWYVGVIIVYAIISPLFYYLARDKRVAIVSIVVFFVIGSAFHHPFASPLLWMSIYMMGAFLGVHYPTFLFMCQPLSITYIALITFPLSVWLDHQFDCMLTVNLRTWTSTFFYIGLYDLLDKLVHLKTYRIYKYSFFLYTMHYFPLHVLQGYLIIRFESELACWIAYILVPAAVVILCVWTAYLMDIKCHKLYSLLSGSR